MIITTRAASWAVKSQARRALRAETSTDDMVNARTESPGDMR